MKDKKILDSEIKYQDLDHVDKGRVEKTLAGNKGYSRREVMKLAALLVLHWPLPRTY